MDETEKADPRSSTTSLTVRVMVWFIAVYRYFLSPFIGQHCRFHPTCSLYGREALLQHGALRGTILTLLRLARCHPWASGGYDPVPAQTTLSCTTDKRD